MPTQSLSADAGTLFEDHPAVTLLTDPDSGRILAANHAAQRFYGWDRSTLLRMHVADLDDGVDRVDGLDGLDGPSAIAATTGPTRAATWYATRHLLASGEVRDVGVVSRALVLNGREVRCAVVTDQADRRAQDEPHGLQLACGRPPDLVERSSDLIVVAAVDGSLIYASPSTGTFLGEDPPHCRALVERLDADDLRRVLAAWRAVLAGTGTSRDVAVRVRRRDGRWRHLAVVMTNVSHVAALDGVLINARDVTHERHVRARLEHQTTHDALTGLATRAVLVERLRRLGADPSVDAYVLMLLDIVDMAGINDRLDHHIGDDVLRAIAARLTRVVGEAGIVARTSGDEFGVLWFGLDGEAVARAAAGRLAETFLVPHEVAGGARVTTSARFGIALSTQSDGTASGILQDADLALADSRAAGGPMIDICSDELRARHRRRLAIEHGLASPEVTDQLDLHYQPIVDLGSGRAIGVEALLRWNHPELGPISPSEFVPVAERTGAIVALGEWVLDRGCRQLAAWDRAGGPAHLWLSVNISPRQLTDPGLVFHVRRVLERTGVAASRLWVEITETTVADDSDATTSSVQELGELGVSIHIDDFGTGYSSLAQLGRFPFDGLKIDRSFVAPLGDDEDAEPLVAAILTLARSQGLHVIAEGVERADQRDILAGLGCRWAQGYLWSVPIDAEGMLHLLDGPLGAGVCRPGDTTTDGDVTGITRSLSYAALDLVENMLVITDRGGSIVYVNKAFTEVTGYEPEEAIGGNPSLLSSGIQSQEFYAHLWAGILEGESWTGELVNRRKDGELYTDHMTITPLHGAGGVVTHFVAVKRDVSSKLAALTAGNPAGIAHADATGRLVYANERLSALLGRPFDELLGHGWLDAMEPACRATVARDLRAAANDPDRVSAIELSSGHSLRVHYAPLHAAASHDHAGIVATFADVTDEIRAVRRLQEREAYTRSILESLDAPTVVVDADGIIRDVNRAWRQTRGLVGAGVPDAGMGSDYRSVRRLASPTSEPGRDAVIGALDRVLAGQVPMETVDDHLVEPDPTWWEVHITPLERSQGGAVVTYNDITLRHQLQTLLELQASTDQLTGLANRTGLLQHGAGALARSRRSGAPLTVLFIDLDRFKPVNDAHGHPAGDRVLQVCAERLRGLVRETDGVARVGGDEFVIVCEDLHEDAVGGLISRIERCLAEPIDVGCPVVVSASIGVVRADGTASLEQLIADADALMYVSKGSKRR